MYCKCSQLQINEYYSFYYVFVISNSWFRKINSNHEKRLDSGKKKYIQLRIRENSINVNVVYIIHNVQSFIISRRSIVVTY